MVKERITPIEAVQVPLFSKRVIEALPKADESFDEDALHAATLRLERALGKPPYSTRSYTDPFKRALRANNDGIRQVYTQAYGSLFLGQTVLGECQDLLPPSARDAYRFEVSEQNEAEIIDRQLYAMRLGYVAPALVGSTMYEAHRNLFFSQTGNSTYHVPMWVFPPLTERPTNERTEWVTQSLSAQPAAALESISTQVPRGMKNPHWRINNTEYPMRSTIVVTGKRSAQYLTSPGALAQTVVVVGTGGLKDAFAAQKKGWDRTTSFIEEIVVGGKPLMLPIGRDPKRFNPADGRLMNMAYTIYTALTDRNHQEAVDVLFSTPKELQKKAGSF